jgi:hypothetical protein
LKGIPSSGINNTKRITYISSFVKRRDRENQALLGPMRHVTTARAGLNPHPESAKPCGLE